MRLRSGQTIMEMLVAFVIISVGLLSAMTLVYSNLNLVTRDADEVIAVNLAREGVELAKQMRDSNWLAGQSFDAGLVNPLNPTDYTATPMWEGVFMSGPPSVAPSFSFLPEDFTDTRVNIVRTTNNLFANTAPELNISGTAMPFQRLLTFHPICDDFITILDSGATCVGTGKTKIGIRVESRIQWTRGNAARNFTVYEDIYNWQ